MRRRFHPNSDGTEIAITNFALTFAKALLVFCVVMFMLINPQQGKDGTKPKAEYLLTIDWTGAGKYDVDTWLQLPDGSEVNFHNKEAGIAFLERDDLGNTCDLTTTAGKAINACEEIVVLRGVVPGEYVLALHLFSAGGSTANGVETTPIKVQMKIERLNPTVIIVWQGTVTLTHIRQEKGVVRFSVMEAGEVSDFNTDELPTLVYRGHE